MRDDDFTGEFCDGRPAKFGMAKPDLQGARVPKTTNKGRQGQGDGIMKKTGIGGDATKDMVLDDFGRSPSPTRVGWIWIFFLVLRSHF